MATINDLVLVHMDQKPTYFARIDDINPDVKRGWYQVELLVLGFPVQRIIWILNETHLAGQEFTMGGTPVRLELIPPKTAPAPPPASDSSPRGRVIPLKRK